MYSYKDFTIKMLDEASGFDVNPNGGILNPGLAVYDHKLYLAYRTGYDWRTPTNIVIAVLNGDWQPIEPFRRLRLPNQNMTLEDPRLFIHKNKLWISTVMVSGVQPSIGFTRIAIAQYPDCIFMPLSYTGKQRPSIAKMSPNWEKNWIFFEYNSELYCTYSLHDGVHTVCKIVDSTAIPMYHTRYKCPYTYKGHVRGTSSLVMKDGLLWGVAHTSITDRSDRQCWKLHYSALFYAMEPYPPFRIVKIQDDAMFYNPQMEHIALKRANLNVVFPSGLLLEQNTNWIIGSGINDIRIAILRIPHSTVLETTIDCAIPA